MLWRIGRSLNALRPGLIGVNRHVGLPLPFHGSMRFLSAKESDTDKNLTTPAISLCRLNNHPDFRLKQAKARLESKSHPNPESKGRKTTEDGGRQRYILSENPTRSTDGTSSGALVEDRLRQARRKILESITEASKNKQSSKPGTVKRKRGRYSKIVLEHGLSISPNENPVRSNDGTSSGALINDRLRMARRKALERMSKSMPESSTMQSAQASPLESRIDTSQSNKRFIDTSIATSKTIVKEHGLGIWAIENPIRSNDGNSSGAVVNDRLRMARRKALESMGKSMPEPSTMQPAQPTKEANTKTVPNYKAFIDTSIGKPNNMVKEQGLAMSALENPI